jgi:predicted  nucleic acid-binding Zn-ribbon protein
MQKMLLQLVKKNINDLKDLEKSYKDNETTLENMESQLKVYETQLALGQTTQIVVDAYKLQIEQLKNTQQTIVYNHDLLLRQFNNPNLLG